MELPEPVDPLGPVDPPGPMDPPQPVDPPEPRLSGLVLAGGHSRRMGRDKAHVTVDGVRLVDRALAVLAVLADELLVARGGLAPIGVSGAREFADAAEDAGPLGGLVAGLEAARHERVAVLAVDLPDASPTVLRRLAATIGDADVALPVVGDRDQPLHAVWTRRCAASLRSRLTGSDRSLHGALTGLTVARVGPAGWSDLDPSGAFARNVNRPEDL